MKRGLSLITVMVSLVILLVGVFAMVKVLPVMQGSSSRASRTVSAAMIADRVFTMLEEEYGSASGPAVPASLDGTDKDFPEYQYTAYCTEYKPGLYRVDLDITWKQEGGQRTRSFHGTIHRR